MDRSYAHLRRIPHPTYVLYTTLWLSGVASASVAEAQTVNVFPQLLLVDKNTCAGWPEQGRA
jgi:hypothetical protein